METKRTIESRGENVEIAVKSGLRKLGVEREMVEVEVLDEGSRGLLGFGARPAHVRLTYTEPAPPPPAEPQPQPPEKPSPPPVIEAEPPAAPAAEPEPAPAPPEPEAEPDLKPEVLDTARQALEELLDHMGISAQIEAHSQPPEEGEDLPRHILNVRGSDLGALIGRRGETLDALQYITRLILGREYERRVYLTVDVEGYRARRERALRQLAQRMAERTVSTGRKSVLEPMPPAERRIVHVELRNHPDVVTESVGQGDKRKVTIFLKKQKR